MKDERGLYYYPSMQDRATRMYVRENGNGEIEFRLWNSKAPELWDRHHWITRDVVEAAVPHYQGRSDDHKKRNPLSLYDEDVARRLIDEDKAARS